MLLLLFYYPVFSLSIDLKTKMAEKIEFNAIKVGAIYFIEKMGIQVVNFGEDFSVWLKNLERRYVNENCYAYTLTVKLSYPTSLIEKQAIKEVELNFQIVMDIPLKNQNTRLDNHLRHLSKMGKRYRYEAYIGGMAVAACVEDLLFSVGSLKQN